MGPNVQLVSPGAETAEYLIKKLKQADALAEPNRSGRHRYYVTDSAESFRRQASLFMASDISGEVSEAELL